MSCLKTCSTPTSSPVRTALLVITAAALGAASSMLATRRRRARAAGDPRTAAELYDLGGFLRPGFTYVINTSGSPESVWTSEEMSWEIEL